MGLGASRLVGRLREDAIVEGKSEAERPSPQERAATSDSYERSRESASRERQPESWIMFAVDDTIVAIATPLGRGAIGVVRLSGPDAASIAARLADRTDPFAPRYATLATLSLPLPATSVPGLQNLRDQAVITYFVRPSSYTGEDVVEISAHGSSVVLQSIVRAAMACGARLAEPGEFTLRAFLNGKLDLIQAEAVADLVESVTPAQARVAFDQLEGTLTADIRAIESALFDLMARLEASLDFPDEGYHFVTRAAAVGELDQIVARVAALIADAGRGRLIREGAQVAIVGAPNVGKSSLFNRLLDANRAIVTPLPGTTRDLLTERVDLRGISTLLIDTAGLRESVDPVEQEGIKRARGAVSVADLTLVVLDRSRPLEDGDRRVLDETRAVPRLVIANKIDLPAAWSTPGSEQDESLEISVATGEGVEALIARVGAALSGGDEKRDAPLVSNLRHVAQLRATHAALLRASTALRETPASEEFVLADLQEASGALQEITGARTTEELLTHIFARFCLGK